MPQYQYEIRDATCDPERPTIPCHGIEMEFSPGLYDGLMETTFTPSQLAHKPWLAGAVKSLWFRQTHDGTFLFIYQGVSLISDAAEHFAEQQGGEWEVSNVFVCVTYKKSVRLPAGNFQGQDDIYIINMRRIDQ